MRVLKMLVILMGILLIIGFVVLGFAVSKKMNEPDVILEDASTLLKRAHIQQMSASEGVLTLWVKHEGHDQILLINMKTGKIIRKI